MKIRLVNVGRSKVNRTIEIPDGSTLDQIAEEIESEARHHLMSSEVFVEWDGKKGVIFAGFHQVGEAELE